MGYPDKLYEIMLECWRDEWANRPTIETLQRKLEDFFCPHIFARPVALFPKVAVCLQRNRNYLTTIVS